MLMKYIAGLQKSYLRIFYPLPLLVFYFPSFFCFFQSENFKQFFWKIGVFRSLPSKSCISAKNACTELILGSFER